MKNLKQKFSKNYTPAVAAVLLCKDEVFMIQRQPHLNAFPGYYSFPGGKVDDDEEKFEISNSLLKGFNQKHLKALFRELEEELSFDLAKEFQKNNVIKFQEMGTSCTPPIEHRWFCVHYFLVELRKKPSFTPDIQEIDQACWQTAIEQLKRYEQGKLLAVEATISILNYLHSRNQSLPLDLQTDFDNEKEIVAVEPLSGIKVFPVLSQTLKPAERTNAYLIGDDSAPSILVDPSPVNSRELNKLIYSLKPFNIDKVFITHHHVDHHQNASEVASYFNADIYMNRLTDERIRDLYGAEYFKDNTILYVEDEDVITKWKGKDVIVHALSGHDRGQMGLATRDMSWFLVGDLIQGVGTVVVAAPYGDMTDYFDTLQKILDFDPEVIFPSHGIPMGGVHRIQKTLEHRLSREKTILSLLNENKSPEDMLGIIYPDLSEFLKPYALKSIEAHISKIDTQLNEET